MKSGKYTLGVKTTLKCLRSGKGMVGHVYFNFFVIVSAPYVLLYPMCSIATLSKCIVNMLETHTLKSCQRKFLCILLLHLSC